MEQSWTRRRRLFQLVLMICLLMVAFIVSYVVKHEVITQIERSEKADMMKKADTIALVLRNEPIDLFDQWLRHLQTEAENIDVKGEASAVWLMYRGIDGSIDYPLDSDRYWQVKKIVDIDNRQWTITIVRERENRLADVTKKLQQLASITVLLAMVAYIMIDRFMKQRVWQPLFERQQHVANVFKYHQIDDRQPISLSLQQLIYRYVVREREVVWAAIRPLIDSYRQRINEQLYREVSNVEQSVVQQLTIVEQWERGLVPVLTETFTIVEQCERTIAEVRRDVPYIAWNFHNLVATPTIIIGHRESLHAALKLLCKYAEQPEPESVYMTYSETEQHRVITIDYRQRQSLPKIENSPWYVYVQAVMLAHFAQLQWEEATLIITFEKI